MANVINPFRLPVHPPLVHFPIAMLVLAWACLVLRYITGDVRWDQRARLFHVIGVGSLPIVLVSALIDTRGIGFLLSPRWEAPLVWHALAGVVVTAIMSMHFLWRRRRAADAMVGRLAVLDLVIGGAGVWVLLAVGLIAGEMVYGS